MDQLIYQTLLDDVRGKEPSPQVWENICQSIAAKDAPELRRGTTRRIFALLDGALIVLNAFLYDGSWETRLREHQKPVFWTLPFSGNLAVAV